MPTQRFDVTVNLSINKVWWTVILLVSTICKCGALQDPPSYPIQSSRDLEALLSHNYSSVAHSNGQRGTSLRATISLIPSVLEIDQPFFIDHKDPAAATELIFSPTENDTATGGFNVIRCRKAQSAFIIRSQYGAVKLQGKLQIENCGDTAVIIETLPEPEVSMTYQSFNAPSEVPYVRLEGLRLVNNNGRDGGAVRVHGALVDLYNVVLKNNTAMRGAALFMTAQSTLNQMRGCTVEGNRVWSPSQSPSDINRGGAIHLDQDVCVGNITTTTFRNNVGSRGGALLIGGHTSRCSTKRFFPCDVACERRLNDTGALNFYLGPGLVFEGNKAFYDGGGLFVIQEHPELGSEGLVDRCQFKNNEAILGSGGALWCQAGEGMVVIETVLDGNRAGRGGGAIRFSGSHFGFLFVNDSSLMNNEVLIAAEQAFPSHPSAPLLNWDTGSGGAIAATGFMGVSLNNDTLTNNSAPLQGGGLFCYSCISIDVLNSTFEQNNAGSGGGAVSSPMLLATSRIERSTFTRNSANGIPTAIERHLMTRTTAKEQPVPPGGSPISPELYSPVQWHNKKRPLGNNWVYHAPPSLDSLIAIDDDPSNGFVYGGNLSSLLGPCGSGGAGGGGALCVQPLSRRVKISNLRLSGNRAPLGGSLYLETLFCQHMQKSCPVQLANITIDGHMVDDTSGGAELYISSKNRKMVSEHERG